MRERTSNMKERMDFNEKVENACDAILSCPRSFQGDKNFVNGVIAFGDRTGFITAGQAEQLGKTYKRTVNEGVYIKHDWWD